MPLNRSTAIQYNEVVRHFIKSYHIRGFRFSESRLRPQAHRVDLALMGSRKVHPYFSLSISLAEWADVQLPSALAMANPNRDESADSSIFYFDQGGQDQPSPSHSVGSAQTVPVDAAYQYFDSSLAPVAGTASMQQLVRYGYPL
jgi:hypothetical protein